MKPFRKGNKTSVAGDLEPGRNAASSDAELVRAARRGDKQAFVEIVARHQAMVCGTALGILGNIAASEDAGQEAFLTAWRKIHELREPERLRAWLRQIARHAALGYQRRQHGHDTIEVAPELPDLGPAPDEQAASEEEVALVREALARLPEAYREPLILYYRENQSTRAVAEALDISEDAVRQRLARGREMLRDQVSGVIENVLTRTRPTPIFTMSIAVAIGALTAPAAVAGGVFSAAAAAGPDVGTLASFFKSVFASKTFLFVAAMATLVCIPLGYGVRMLEESRVMDASVLENRVVAEETDRSSRFEDGAIFAEWRRLHQTHGTNVEAMPNIYNEISRFNNSLWRRGFRAALIAEWVQLDPTNGLACFRQGIIEASQRRQFIDEWMARDAGAAVDAIRASGRGWEPTVRGLLADLARRAPSRLPGVVAKLPGPEGARDTQVQDAFALVAELGIDEARRAAESLQGPNHDQALAGVAQTWAKQDPEAALAWARNASHGPDRDDVIRAALTGMATTDPVSALEKVDSIPPGGKRGYFASTTGAKVLHEAAAVDFDATVLWLAAHPGRLSDEDLMGLAGAVSEKLEADALGFLNRYAASGLLGTLLPAVTNALVKESSGQRSAVWDWLQGQRSNATTRVLAQHLLGTLGEQDTPAAFRLATDAAYSGEGGEQLRLLADGLLHHGAALHRLDRLVMEAPERLRPALVECAFNHLRWETLADPQPWIARLSQLPNAMRTSGMASLAGAWAEQMPEEAVGWVTSLPAGDHRARAMAAVASAWAAQDPLAAAVWVAGMSGGTERDRSVQALVLAIAEEFPREAWDWAMSIDEPEGRTRAATHAARMMAAWDVSIARSWIENGRLTPEAKAAIQSTLDATRNAHSAP
jgi:RNA polymerase sigma factor (sigma-70 family)